MLADLGMAWFSARLSRSMNDSEPANGPATVLLPEGLGTVRTFLRVLGPAYLVAVGCMDPGNWATDLAAGSTYGYRLLWPRLRLACCRSAGAFRSGCWRRWRSSPAIWPSSWAAPSP